MFQLSQKKMWLEMVMLKRTPTQVREVRPFRGRWHVNSFLNANSNTDKRKDAAEPSISVSIYRWGFHFEYASYNLLWDTGELFSPDVHGSSPWPIQFSNFLCCSDVTSSGSPLWSAGASTSLLLPWQLCIKSCFMFLKRMIQFLSGRKSTYLCNYLLSVSSVF